MVDHSTDVLSAYVYPEGEGKKGGNNVSSLLYKKLEEEGILKMAKEEGPGKELCLVFDNCAGQNKNRMVLRFAQYLVDIGVFEKVEVIFLVMGHTKNICDRRFKDMKMGFHNKNVYTYKQLLSILAEGKISEDKNKYVDIISVDHNDFYDWDSFLNESYTPRITSVSLYHAFYYSTAANGEISKSTTVQEDSEIFKQKLRKINKKATTEQIDQWTNRLKSSFPKHDKFLGLSDIKQVELYTKWRNCIPHVFQDEMCPKPSDKVLDKIKKEKAEKAKRKKVNLKNVVSVKAKGKNDEIQPQVNDAPVQKIDFTHI